MSAARVLGVLLPLVFLVAAAGIPLMLWWERKRPTAYTRTPMHLGGEPTLAEWQGMTTAGQEAYDTAVLNASEAAEGAARRAAEQRLERAVYVNSLFRP